MEKIVAVAILIEPIVSDGAPKPDGGIILTARPPHRHHHLLPAGYVAKGNAPVSPKEQGFLTSSGRFVDRVEALSIVLQSRQRFGGQLKLGDYKELYSEHLW
jgi:hypothetical protein